MQKADDVAAARAALARVCGARSDVERVQLAPMAGGTQRRSWLVTFPDGERCVLRTPVRSNALLDIETEARAMSAAAAAGVAPAVLAIDAESGVLLTEYRPGTPWTPAVARRPANITRLAAVLETLHRVPIDLPVFAAERIACRYLAAVEALPPSAREARSTQWGDELLARARRYDADYAPSAFCHNDLVAANVLDGGELALVDFEYAVRAEPLLDLASLAGMNGFGGAEQRALLEAYRRAAPTTVEIAELESLVRMVRLIAWFWARLGAANAADSAPYSRYVTELAADLQQE